MNIVKGVSILNSKVKIVLLLVVVCVVIGGIFGFLYLRRNQRYQQAVRDIVIREVNLADIKDGHYKGVCDVDFIKAEVQVDVQGHQIKDIKFIEYKHDRGKKAARLIDDMVKEQKIKVDTVSGATNSSKVIQKAVENALEDR